MMPWVRALITLGSRFSPSPSAAVAMDIVSLLCALRCGCLHLETPHYRPAQSRLPPVHGPVSHTGKPFRNNHFLCSASVDLPRFARSIRCPLLPFRPHIPRSLHPAWVDRPGPVV